MTVSRTINGDPHVDGETRERVLRAAQDLGYKAFHNNDARRLVSRRRGSAAQTRVVCLLRYSPVPMPALRDPWVMHLSAGMEATLYAAERQVLLADIRDGRIPANIRAGVVDGVIALCPRPGVLPALASLEVPVVGAANELLPIHACQDDYAAGRLATEHLLSLGHTRIALLHPLTSPNAAARQRGFQAALAGAGVPADPDLLLTGESDDAEDTVSLLRQRWRHGSRFTAIVAYNDEVAAWALRTAETLGIRVPEQLSIIGVDDLPWVTFLHPPLTTVRLPLVSIGEAAADLLLSLLEARQKGAPAPAENLVRRRLPVELVVRGTTAAPPPSNMPELF